MLAWHLVSFVSCISKKEDTAPGVTNTEPGAGTASPQALLLPSPLPSTPTLQLPF